MKIKKSIAGLLAVTALVAGGAGALSSVSATEEERATQSTRINLCMKASWPPKPCRSV